MKVSTLLILVSKKKLVSNISSSPFLKIIKFCSPFSKVSPNSITVIIQAVLGMSSSTCLGVYRNLILSKVKLHLSQSCHVLKFLLYMQNKKNGLLLQNKGQLSSRFFL